MIYDIQDAKWLIGYSALIALGTSFVLMLLMWLMAGIIFWLLAFASIGILIAFGAYLLYEEYHPGKLNSGINAARIKYLDFIFRNKVLLICVSVLCFLLALYILWVVLSKGKIIVKITPLIS